MGGYGPMGGMFTIVPIFIMIIAVIILVTIVVNIGKSVKTWNYNNAQPVLTVDAKIVAKRTAVSTSTHHDADNIGHHQHAYTDYYVTFEVESGDRMELKVIDEEYGMLVEGDKGKLTFQGTRYKGFKRHIYGESDI